MGHFLLRALYAEFRNSVYWITLFLIAYIIFWLLLLSLRFFMTKKLCETARMAFVKFAGEDHQIMLQYVTDQSHAFLSLKVSPSFLQAPNELTAHSRS